VIILSGVLVIIAIALLVAGIVVGETGGEIANLVDGMTVIYMSIAVSIVSFLCLLVGVFLRRKELFGAAGGPAAGRGKAAKDRRSARLKAERAEADDATELPPSPDVPPEATVYVVLGRKRYHIDSCRQLTGRDKQDLTYAEAREEGFSPCTACMPDTALAARAAGRDTSGDDAAVASAGVAGSDTDFGATEVDGGTAITEYGAYGAADSGYGAPAEDSATGDVRVHYGNDAHEYSGAEPTGEVGSAYTASEMSAGVVGARSAGARADSATGAPDTYVHILAGTSRYHRPDCALIEDVTGDSGTDDLQSLTAASAQAQGYTACLMCRPDREHAHD
jgi:hypothetical protein